LLIAGCSSGQQAGTGGQGVRPVSGNITIAYLQKQGDQQYFIDEAAGAQAAAKALSTPGSTVTVKVVNLGQDANMAVTETDSAVAQKVNGIAIVVPDQKIGPQVANSAASAGIPLVASDDSLKDGAGADVPFVGFDGYDMGSKVGTEAAKRVVPKHWNPADTAVVYASKQDLTVCQDRVRGEQVRYTAGGGVGKAIDVGTDNSVNGAQVAASGIITGNPTVKNWVVMGCNDENVSGVLQALANAKVPAGNAIGVGLGAYLACKSWQPGAVPDGFVSALYIDGHDVGGDAVRTLVAKIRNGKPLPPTTIAKTQIVDAATAGSTTLKCT
jgi:L-arabinose transport system substrate-binding protein